MKLIKKVLYFLFFVVFIISLSLNVIFVVSNKRFTDDSNELIKENHKNFELIGVDTRLTLYNEATSTIYNGKAFTIKSENEYSNNSVAVDLISCSLLEASSSQFNCEMISNLYDDESNLIRTSYFPGDGYKYSVEGNNKTKSVYPNTSLQNYFSSFITGAIYSLYYLVFDYDAPEYADYIQYSTSINASNGITSINKEISASYDNGSSSAIYNYLFDGKDRLIKLEIGTSIMDIDYNSSELQFPQFNSDYIEQ